MDIFLLIIGSLAMIIGIIGSILPMLPGPPVSWIGLLLLHFSKYAEFSGLFLWITGGITVAIVMMDYLFPIMMTKKYGGTKYGKWGATVGTIAGLFLGPWGIIIGPFAGALAGEIIFNPQDTKRSLKVAIGSLAGFLLSTGIKLIWCMFLAFWFVKELV